MIEFLKNKIKEIQKEIGPTTKNLLKVVSKILLPGIGEVIADGFDCIFEIIEHQDDVNWKDKVDENLRIIQTDQQQYLNLLSIIDNNVNNLFLKIANECQQILKKVEDQDRAEETVLTALINKSMILQENQFNLLKKDLEKSSQNFQTISQKLDQMIEKQFEVDIILKKENIELKEVMNMVKKLYIQFSEHVREYETSKIKQNQNLIDFIIQIEHEIIHQNINQARITLENAFNKKVIDLPLKQLYECRINTLKGHLQEVEILLDQSKELAQLKELQKIKQQVKDVSQLVSSQEQYQQIRYKPDMIIGDQLWKLDKLISMGSMGEIWVAKNMKGETGAIKFLNQAIFQDTLAQKALFEEIDHLTKLQHPNIAKFKDWGKDNEQFFLVMEYIEGKSLRQIINQKNYLPWDEAKLIFKDIIEALCICHKEKIFHLNIKPEHMMIKENDHHQKKLILIEFELSNLKKFYNKNSKDTTRSIKSNQYMSPEQKKGDKIDGKIDVYALGLTILETLTGKSIIDTKLGNKFGKEILDILGQCINDWETRYDMFLLFEKFGGNLNTLTNDHSNSQFEKLKQDLENIQTLNKKKKKKKKLKVKKLKN